MNDPIQVQHEFVVVPSWISVDELLAGPRATGVYPVLDRDGRLVGMLDLADLASHPELHDRTAGDVVDPPAAASRVRRHLIFDGDRLVAFRTVETGRTTTRRKAS